MNKEDIIYLLKNRKLLLRGIQTARASLFRYVDEEKNRDTILRQLSLPGASEHVGGRSYKEPDTIFHIVDQYKKIRATQIEELRAELNRISCSEACINHLFKCLYSMREPGRSVLLMLYIENTKWDVVCSELEISNGRLGECRRKALKTLLTLRNSTAGDFEKKGEEVLFGTVKQAEKEKKESQVERLKAVSDSLNPLSIEALKKELTNMQEVEGQMSLFGGGNEKWMRD